MRKTGLFIGLVMLVYGFASWSADDDSNSMVPAYVSLGEPMVLNLTSNKKRRSFLQVKVEVFIADANSEPEISMHTAAIRHELILLLSEQDAAHMKSRIKREEIRKIATAKVQDLMSDLGLNVKVNEVLFSEFLVQ